jgi:hypothetical protein
MTALRFVHCNINAPPTQQGLLIREAPGIVTKGACAKIGQIHQSARMAAVSRQWRRMMMSSFEEERTAQEAALAVEGDATLSIESGAGGGT